MKLILQPKAKKQFLKLDFTIRRRFEVFFDDLQTMKNPREKGKALAGNLNGLWRYRIGNYRLICDIDDDELIIYALKIGHRKGIYN